GAEQQLTHDLPVEFPAQALSRISSIKRITICQGSGLFASIVEYDGDFKAVFDEYVSSPSVQAFHFKIAKFFESAPQSAEPAALPLVGDVFTWDGSSFQRAAG